MLIVHLSSCVNLMIAFQWTEIWHNNYYYSSSSFIMPSFSKLTYRWKVKANENVNELLAVYPLRLYLVDNSHIHSIHVWYLHIYNSWSSGIQAKVMHHHSVKSFSPRYNLQRIWTEMEFLTKQPGNKYKLREKSCLQDGAEPAAFVLKLF